MKNNQQTVVNDVDIHINLNTDKKCLKQFYSSPTLRVWSVKDTAGKSVTAAEGGGSTGPS